MNRRIHFVRAPIGLPDESTFRMEASVVPTLEDGQLLVRSLYISVDPYMRGRMRGMKTYTSAFTLGAPMTGGVVGRVESSRNQEFETGDIVVGHLEWADFTLTDGRGLRKLDPTVAPVSTALHILGMPGLTAYFGLLEIGRPKSGETVVVTAAAGAVGSAVCQIAKIMGCRVVGIAGSALKCRFIRDELGADAAIDYKKDDLDAALKSACPDGVDVYFDNVGGPVSDVVLEHLNNFARIPICGQISDYNAEERALGPRPFGRLLIRRALAQGFIVSDFAAQNKEALAQLAAWVSEGRITYREHITAGLEHAPRAFIGLFHGENLGKALVKVAE